MNLCRSITLGAHDYLCKPCKADAVVYNSCGERHCCRCSGFFRYNWLVKTQALLVPKTAYLQIVFTVPDTIGALLLHSPSKAYAMLMRTAARETMRLQAKLGITPGAIVVLHTWNQRMLHHAHVHVLIPIAGIPVTSDTDWITIRDRPELSQGDQVELGHSFRRAIIRRIKRLQKHGKLTFGGSHQHLNDPAALTQYINSIAVGDYRVFVQHAPNASSDPATVVKYLARYVSGGPISDRRIVSADGDKVTFLVRDNQSASNGQRKGQIPITIDQTEFVRRWSLHILPKGFVRVRSYGHASNSCRNEYLAKCRERLGIADPNEPVSEDPSRNEDNTDDDTDDDRKFVGEDDDDFEIPCGVSKCCPKCGKRMTCVSSTYRPSWKVIMAGPHRPAWYES